MPRQPSYTSALLCAALLCASPAVAQETDDTTLSYTITINPPGPTCTISNISALDFGSHDIEDSGSGSVTRGTSNGGRAALQGDHLTSWSVSVSLPSSLGSAVSLSLGWWQSSNGSSWTSKGSASSHSGTGGGMWSTTTHYFAFTGTASWDWGDVDGGTFTATIGVTATCS